MITSVAAEQIVGASGGERVSQLDSSGDAWSISSRQLVFLPEPAVHEPRKRTGNQKNNQRYEIDAFDLLFVDYSENIAKSGLVPHDAPHVMRFTETDKEKPQNRKDEANNGNCFSSGRAHY